MPPDLPDMVAKLLRQQALSLLSLAKKAGEAVAGFMKVEEMLGRGRAKLLFHGTDAALDGCRKLDKLAEPGVEKIVLFERANWIWLLGGQMWYMLPWPREGLPKSSPLPCAGSRCLRASDGPTEDLKREDD